MLRQIAVDELSGDFVVQVHILLPGDFHPRWYSVMNFGDRQGDAIEMKDHDLPKMMDDRIIALIRRHSEDPFRKMQRVSPGNYRHQVPDPPPPPPRHPDLMV